MASKDAAQPPRERCHNCRRQRLRCDRSYPHCNKCLLAGKECLGYGQLFRWTGAIASRGKLAGKTSIANSSEASDAASDQGRQQIPARAPAPVIFAAPGSSKASSALRAKRKSLSSIKTESVPASPPSEAGEWQLATLGRWANAAPSSPWVLADPLVQDLSHSYRHYLSYFATRLCKDLVSFDLPDRNPFRSLVPLTMDNPLLQHIIVANSAAHMSNHFRPELPPVVDPDLQSMVPSSSEASRGALRDALIAKNQALRLMHQEIQSMNSSRADVALAAAWLFINVELIESGKHGWRAHLEGAGRLVSLLEPAEGATSDLRDYVLSDCFSYFVMASAFTSATSTLQSYFESSQIPTILQRATANSYQCCPPKVLEIIYAASQLSNVKIDGEDCIKEIAAEGMDLLRQAQDLDVRAWAVEALEIPYLRNIPLTSRINAGSAHRIAACLYIVQAVEPVSDLVGPELAVELENDLFEQLTRILPDDPNYKATSWPTFIVGASAKTCERRVWVMERLQQLVCSVPWGFLYTAMETLPIIWKLDNSEKEGRTWVQTVKDPEVNFLMV